MKKDPMKKIYDDCIDHNYLSYDLLNTISNGLLKEYNIKKAKNVTFYKPVFSKKEGALLKRAEECRVRYIKGHWTDYEITDIIEFLKEDDQATKEYVMEISKSLIQTDLEYLLGVTSAKLRRDYQGFEDACMIGIRGVFDPKILKQRKISLIIKNSLEEKCGNKYPSPF